MQSSISILGTGRATPKQRLASEHFDAICGLESGSLFTATGVAYRHVSTSEDQIDLALRAVARALDAASIDVEDIDLIISACGIGYQAIPTTAPLIMARLGLTDGRAAAFDVNSTCLSFLTGVETAQNLIASGQFKRALVVSSEIASRALPWESDPQTAALFGDGAAAAVIGPAEHSGCRLATSLMRTYPSAYDASSLRAGGTRIDIRAQPEDFARHAVFQMDGCALFRVVATHFGTFCDDLLARAGWDISEVDVIVPHQASPLALRRMTRMLGVSPAKVVDIARDYGNQIAASIPFALDYALRERALPRGTKILLLGTSAGVSLGGMAWEL